MRIKVVVSVLSILLSSSSNFDIAEKKEKPIEYKYGYNIDQYIFEEKKIKSGDTFGDILEGVGIDYPEIYEALQKTKGDVNFKKPPFNLGLPPHHLLYDTNSLSVTGYPIISSILFTIIWSISIIIISSSGF